MLNGGTHSGSHTERFAIKKMFGKKDKQDDEANDTNTHGANPVAPPPRHTRSPEPPLHHAAPDTPMPYTLSDNPTPLSRSSSVAKPKDAALLALKDELARQYARLNSRQHEKNRLERDNASLGDQLNELRDRLRLRQEDTQQLQFNYTEYLHSSRATSDNLDTIVDKIRALRNHIHALAADLIQHVSTKKATQGLQHILKEHFYKSIVKEFGDPIPPKYIKLLTEKYVMDELSKYFKPGLYFGISVTEAARDLDAWMLEQHQMDYVCRLRQEIARVVVQADSTAIKQSFDDEVLSCTRRLLNNLLQVYPHMQAHDRMEKDASKRYTTRVEHMVSEVLRLGYIMKGQEVSLDVTTEPEGKIHFNPNTMVNEGGQGSGVVQFIINPPIVVTPDKILLKARVLCQPSH